jgi:Ca2+-binding EF-hand superfamily protein
MIDLEEFTAKICAGNEEAVHSDLLISKARFLNILMEEWRSHTEREKKSIMKTFNQYDDNNDGVLQLCELVL